ncbi:uncharacterized protein [Penaeus vannamei]|uniref:uncharacterized protein n=1 Tax=Penaeus vannamei TaxID=6689 RepID=UPI00387F7050
MSTASEVPSAAETTNSTKVFTALEVSSVTEAIWSYRLIYSIFIYNHYRQCEVNSPTASSVYFKSYNTATDLSTTTSEPTALSTNTTESSTNGLSAQISVPAAPDVFVPAAEREEPLTFVSLACRASAPVIIIIFFTATHVTTNTFPRITTNTSGSGANVASIKPVSTSTGVSFASVGSCTTGVSRKFTTSDSTITASDNVTVAGRKVQAEEAVVLIMFVCHRSRTSHPLVFTTSNDHNATRTS